MLKNKKGAEAEESLGGLIGFSPASPLFVSSTSKFCSNEECFGKSSALSFYKIHCL